MSSPVRIRAPLRGDPPPFSVDVVCLGVKNSSAAVVYPQPSAVALPQSPHSPAMSPSPITNHNGANSNVSTGINNTVMSGLPGSPSRNALAPSAISDHNANSSYVVTVDGAPLLLYGAGFGVVKEYCSTFHMPFPMEESAPQDVALTLLPRHLFVPSAVSHHTAELSTVLLTERSRQLARFGKNHRTTPSLSSSSSSYKDEGLINVIAQENVCDTLEATHLAEITAAIAASSPNNSNRQGSQRAVSLHGDLCHFVPLTGSRKAEVAQLRGQGARGTDELVKAGVLTPLLFRTCDEEEPRKNNGKNGTRTAVTDVLLLSCFPTTLAGQQLDTAPSPTRKTSFFNTSQQRSCYGITIWHERVARTVQSGQEATEVTLVPRRPLLTIATDVHVHHVDGSAHRFLDDVLCGAARPIALGQDYESLKSVVLSDGQSKDPSSTDVVATTTDRNITSGSYAPELIVLPLRHYTPAEDACYAIAEEAERTNSHQQKQHDTTIHNNSFGARVAESTSTRPSNCSTPHRITNGTSFEKKYLFPLRNCIGIRDVLGWIQRRAAEQQVVATNRHRRSDSNNNSGEDEEAGGRGQPVRARLFVTFPYLSVKDYESGSAQVCADLQRVADVLFSCDTDCQLTVEPLRSGDLLMVEGGAEPAGHITDSGVRQIEGEQGAAEPTAQALSAPQEERPQQPEEQQPQSGVTPSISIEHPLPQQQNTQKESAVVHPTTSPQQQCQQEPTSLSRQASAPSSTVLQRPLSQIVEENEQQPQHSQPQSQPHPQPQLQYPEQTKQQPELQQPQQQLQQPQLKTQEQQFTQPVPHLKHVTQQEQHSHAVYPRTQQQPQGLSEHQHASQQQLTHVVDQKAQVYPTQSRSCVYTPQRSYGNDQEEPSRKGTPAVCDVRVVPSAMEAPGANNAYNGDRNGVLYNEKLTQIAPQQQQLQEQKQYQQQKHGLVETPRAATVQQHVAPTRRSIHNPPPSSYTAPTTATDYRMPAVTYSPQQHGVVSSNSRTPSVGATTPSQTRSLSQQLVERLEAALVASEHVSPLRADCGGDSRTVALVRSHPAMVVPVPFAYAPSAEGCAAAVLQLYCFSNECREQEPEVLTLPLTATPGAEQEYTVPPTSFASIRARLGSLLGLHPCGKVYVVERLLVEGAKRGHAAMHKRDLLAAIKAAGVAEDRRLEALIHETRTATSQLHAVTHLSGKGASPGITPIRAAQSGVPVLGQQKGRSTAALIAKYYPAAALPEEGREILRQAAHGAEGEAQETLPGDEDDKFFKDKDDSLYLLTAREVTSLTEILTIAQEQATAYAEAREKLRATGYTDETSECAVSSHSGLRRVPTFTIPLLVTRLGGYVVDLSQLPYAMSLPAVPVRTTVSEAAAPLPLQPSPSSPGAAVHNHNNTSENHRVSSHGCATPPAAANHTTAIRVASAQRGAESVSSSQNHTFSAFMGAGSSAGDQHQQPQMRPSSSCSSTSIVAEETNFGTLVRKVSRPSTPTKPPPPPPAVTTSSTPEGVDTGAATSKQDSEHPTRFSVTLPMPF